ncbi:hypothetical protein FACS1894137_17460 [Spirochaetia bacterium]|nr:hypothetical protein FACS1894137_17460 [Spirochaetia bacterium]
MTSVERREARYQRRKAARDEKRQQKLSQYDDFNQIVDVDNLYESFLESMKGVAWKESVQRYEANAFRNVKETHRKLLAGESVQSDFAEFTLNERGKIRHIKSVHISERIVQKCLCNKALVPILSNSLIYDNGASVKGKGVHFAIKRFIAHLSKFYRQNNYSNNGYALLIDFAKFFDSIDHQVLFKLLENKIKDDRILDLTKKFIRVFGDGKSLGLGSQVSQICAIFYPDQLDHFIKENLDIKFYGRYMDDSYLIHADKEYLKECLEKITVFCEKLKIKINIKKTRIVKLSQGVEFLKGKYLLLPSGRVLRRPCKDSTRRMRRKLIKFKGLVNSGKMTYDNLRTSYQSWRGNYKRRFDAYHRIRYMDKLYNDLFISEHTKNSIGR